MTNQPTQFLCSDQIQRAVEVTVRNRWKNAIQSPKCKSWRKTWHMNERSLRWLHRGEGHRFMLNDYALEVTR
jgi:hypothetical protein